MANDGDLAAGTHVVEADISPREQLFVQRDGVVRKIRPDDSDVTAREIYEANNGHNKFKGVRPMNWPGATKGPQDEDLLTFNAQTTIAASYGLMQVLYSTAIRPINWKNWQSKPNCGAGVDLNPRYLFDTPEGIEHEGGSVAVGTRGLAYFYYRAWGKKPKAELFTMDSYHTFLERWRDLAIPGHNTDGNYWPKMSTNIPTFAPSLSQPVFTD